MVSRAAQDELRRLRSEVTALGDRTRPLVAEATACLLDDAFPTADRLSASVGDIHATAARIEEDCETFLALHAPVAAELRHVVAVVKIAPEIARSADLMANVCRAASRIGPRQIPAALAMLVRRMAEQADKLLAAAIQAHEMQVPVLADAVADMDDHLDGLHRQFVEAVVDESRSGSLGVDAAVQLALVARFYERVGDHAVNVAGIVRFEVQGEMSLVASAEDEIARTGP